jgi:hypothetical protein
MIPRNLRPYWFEGTEPTSDDVRDYAAYLSSSRTDGGSRTDQDSGRAKSSAAATERGKVGAAVGIYDPEWSAWLGMETK